MNPTNEFLREVDLRYLLSLDEPDDEEEPLADIIPVETGEWRFEGDGWRFWHDPFTD